MYYHRVLFVEGDEKISEVKQMINRRDNSSYKETLDRTSSVQVYCTYYYVEEVKGRDTYIDISKIEGGYTIRDKSVKVVGQEVNYGQGAGAVGYQKIENQLANHGIILHQLHGNQLRYHPQ